MKKRQRGMGFAGVLAILVGIIFLAIIGMKMVPAYLEYFAIKQAVAAITQGGQLRNATVADVRKAFELRQAVDDFTAGRTEGPRDHQGRQRDRDLVRLREADPALLQHQHPHRLCRLEPAGEHQGSRLM